MHWVLKRCFALCVVWYALGVGAEVCAQQIVTTVIDNFNRTDEAPVSNGGKWSDDIPGNMSSNLEVQTNVLRENDGITGTGSAWWNAEEFGPNCEVSLTLPDSVGADNDFVGIILRIQGPGATTWDGYQSLFTSLAAGDTVDIRRIDDNAGTTIAGPFTQNFNAAGDAWMLRAMGSRISVHYFNGTTWTELGSATDATYLSAGFFGVRSNNNDGAITMDNLTGGTIRSGGRLLFFP